MSVFWEAGFVFMDLVMVIVCYGVSFLNFTMKGAYSTFMIIKIITIRSHPSTILSRAREKPKQRESNNPRTYNKKETKPRGRL